MLSKVTAASSICAKVGIAGGSFTNGISILGTYSKITVSRLELNPTMPENRVIPRLRHSIYSMYPVQ